MDCIKCGKEIPDGALFCPWCGKKQTTTSTKKYRKRANGTGSIYRMQGRRTKPWAATRNGVFIGTYATRGEAQKALEQITDVDITDRYNLTFSDVFSRWSESHYREISSSQAKAYNAAYKACSDLHAQKYRRLQKSDFQGQIIKRENSGYSQSSCEKMIQLFSSMGTWAEENGIVPRSRASRLRTVAEQKSSGVCLTVEQIQAIQQSGHRAAPVALLMLSTGCRPGELFSVELASCFDDYFIGGSKTEEGRDRLIVVSQVGLEAYHSMVFSAKAAGGTLLIDGYDGNRKAENYAKRDFAKMMQELGIVGVTPVDCRHTYSTYLSRAHCPPQLLRRLMGHTTIQTSDKYYTHMDLEDLRHGAEMLPL